MYYLNVDGNHCCCCDYYHHHHHHHQNRIEIHIKTRPSPFMYFTVEIMSEFVCESCEILVLFK